MSCRIAEILDPFSGLSYISCMKLLITTSTLPLSEDDGMPRFVYDLARALSRFCHVTVLAPYAEGALRTESAGALTIRRFQYSWPSKTQCLAYGDGMRQNLRGSIAARVQIPGYVAALGRAVVGSIRRERFDVVNSHWLVPQGLAAALALGKTSPAAHVVTAHAGDVAFLERMVAGHQVARFVANRSNLFLPVSSLVEKHLRELVRKPIRSVIQPMGVDWDRFASVRSSNTDRLPFNGNYILYVGRLVEKKGLGYLLEALRLLPEGFNATGLVVIGSGALMQPLERSADRLGIRERVMFMGRMGHDQLLPYLCGSAAVALPFIVDAAGETEGMPTVLAEALSAGCKVVASRVGGVCDVVEDGVNGWLAAPGDPPDLAAKLAAALEYSGSEIQRCARQTAQQLDWANIAQNYLAHFNNALRLHRRS